MVFAPNQPYRDDPDAQRWAKHFEREGRDVWEHRERVLEAFELRGGLRVLDLGAGTGAFSRPIAQAVGATGEVLAVEPTPHFAAPLTRLADQVGNLRLFRGVEQVASSCCDLAVCVDTYHHLEFPLKVMDHVHRVLVPGGRLVVIDLILDESSSAALHEHVRRTQYEVETELLRVGFVLERRPPPLPHNYLLSLRRP